MDILGGVLVALLFIIYSSLWKIKRYTLQKSSGIDPEVRKKSKSNLQRYLTHIMKLIKVYVVILIILHTLNLHFYSLFSRFDLLNHIYIKFFGFGVGILGLSFCLYAQVKMGQSWREGIDEETVTDLITTGLYKLIRNPTYLGLCILNIGIWLIWPTWTVFLLNLILIYTLEIQVRCEEDYLENIHGNDYIRYKNSTKRYIPYLY